MRGPLSILHVSLGGHVALIAIKSEYWKPDDNPARDITVISINLNAILRVFEVSIYIDYTFDTSFTRRGYTRSATFTSKQHASRVSTESSEFSPSRAFFHQLRPLQITRGVLSFITFSNK